MSWIVEFLLRNSDEIRSQIVEEQTLEVGNTFTDYEDFGSIYNMESDNYNNLLTVERKIKDLYQSGILSDMDLFIIDTFKNGREIDALEKSLPKKRILSRTFSQICDRVGYFLGDYFTDDGFLENLQKGIKLSDEQIRILRNYMSSRYRHKLIRRIRT